MKQKAIALAIAGVMLFSAMFPVRIGIAALDDARIQQAHAVAPAVVMPVLGAIALASGVFLGGVTTSSYNANLSGMYDYIENFMQTNYDASAETALLGTLTPFGAVNVGLMSAQLKNAIRSYVNDGYADEDISYGNNSSQANEQVIYVNGAPWLSSGMPSCYQAVIDLNLGYSWDNVIGYQYRKGDNSTYYAESYVFFENWRYYLVSDGVAQFSKVNPKYEVWVMPNGSYQSKGWVSESNSTVYNNSDTYQIYLSRDYFDGKSSVTDYGSTTLQVQTGVMERYKAIVNNAIIQGLDSLQGIYEQFSPTDALLEQGISNADLVDAINTNTGTAQDVLSGVNALIGQFTALLTNVGTIGDVIGDIGEDVASIPSVLDDVLEGVLAFPDAISTGLAGVVSAVNAIPASIAGVLEGVTFPIQFPTLPEYDYTGTVSLPVGAWDSFQLSIRDKAPFCYFPRMYNALSAWWNMANVRSFYFDVPLPDGSGQSYVQRFDADDFLSVEYGSTDVATIIRTMVTLSLCFALLYAAVSIAIWSVKGA